MENLLPVWTDHYDINWFDADTGNRATLVSICKFLQESAWRHANHLGFGYRTVQSIDQIWVLIRLLVKMDTYPLWQDKITVKTWPRGVDGLLALRDFTISDENNKQFGAASSQWFILDGVTRKPKPALIVKDILPLVTSTPAMEEQPGKIIIRERLEFAHSFKTSFTDLDINQHVNNTRYIEWILHAFPDQSYHDYFIHSLLIEFLAEAHSGEEIELFWNKGVNPSLFKGVRLEDDKTIFRAKMIWKRRH